MVSYEMQTFTGLFFKYKENIDKNTCKIYKKLVKFRYKVEREVQFLMKYIRGNYKCKQMFGGGDCIDRYIK